VHSPARMTRASRQGAAGAPPLEPTRATYHVAVLSGEWRKYDRKHCSSVRFPVRVRIEIGKGYALVFGDNPMTGGRAVCCTITFGTNVHWHLFLGKLE